jgi:hypothetical protein
MGKAIFRVLVQMDFLLRRQLARLTMQKRALATNAIFTAYVLGILIWISRQLGDTASLYPLVGASVLGWVLLEAIQPLGRTSREVERREQWHWRGALAWLAWVLIGMPFMALVRYLFGAPIEELNTTTVSLGIGMLLGYPVAWVITQLRQKRD